MVLEPGTWLWVGRKNTTLPTNRAGRNNQHYIFNLQDRRGRKCFVVRFNNNNNNLLIYIAQNSLKYKCSNAHSIKITITIKITNKNIIQKQLIKM